MRQQFIRTVGLDKVFAAANAVLAKEKPATWALKAFKYYYIPAPPIGLAGIVVERLTTCIGYRRNSSKWSSPHRDEQHPGGLLQRRADATFRHS